jgi:hypothetical protein
MYFVIYHPVIGFEVASQYAGVWVCTSRPILGAPYKISDSFETPEDANEWLSQAMNTAPFALGQLQLAFLPGEEAGEEEAI